MKSKLILTGAFLVVLFSSEAQFSLMQDLTELEQILELTKEEEIAEPETTKEAVSGFTYFSKFDQGLEVVSVVNEFKGILSIEVDTDPMNQAIILDLNNWPTGVLFNLTDALGNSVNCDEINKNSSFVLNTKNLKKGSYHLNIFDYNTMRSTILLVNKNDKN